MPKATQFVIGLDMELLTGSSVLRPTIARLSVIPELGAIKKECNLDPMQDIDWLLMSITDPIHPVLIVRGRFTRQQLLDCFRKSAHANGDTVVVESTGGIECWGVPGEEALCHFWPAEDVVVIGGGERRDLIEDAKKESGLASELSERVTNVDRTAALWAVGHIPYGPLATSQGVELSVHVGTSLDFTARIEHKRSGDAIVASFEAEVALIKIADAPWAKPITNIVKSTKIEPEGVNVTVALSLSSSDIGLIEQALTPAVP